MDFREASEKIPELLAQHLQLEVRDVLDERVRGTTQAADAPDLTVRLDGLTFDVQYKHRSRAEQVGQAIRAIQGRQSRADGSIPLIVVPYMGGVGRKLCEEAGLSWMDLSGNASIHSGMIRISVLGRKNKFKRRGRRPNLFAPKSARIVRILLIEHDRTYSQQELAQVADVDPGHVSRVVRRLEDAGFVKRDTAHGVSVRNPNLLLDAWKEEYDPDDHRTMKGHLSVRRPQEALERLDPLLREVSDRYAVTGLPAAWLYVRHAGYRLVTLYVDAWPKKPLLEELGWRDQEAGENVQLLRPEDSGVFYGMTEREGFPCVSAVQAYLDLCHLPERASEAAEVLRREWLAWEGHR